MMNSEICELIEACESFDEETDALMQDVNDEIINEEESIDEEENINPVIQWVDTLSVTLKEKNERIKEMTHEELKAMSADQLNKMVMYEWLPDKFVRLYFDFDFTPEKLSNEEATDAFDKCNKICKRLSKTFGKFSYGGYTTNEDVADFNEIRYYEQDMKTLSLHVVFYESKVLRSYLHILK